MERLKERIEVAQKALATLKDVLDNTMPDKVIRDAAIQRFEYTFEAIWKAAQRLLFVREGLSVGSPKGVIRASFQTGLLEEGETEQALQMVDDRNLITHMYNEDLAQSLYNRLPQHADLMDLWLDQIIERIALNP